MVRNLNGVHQEVPSVAVLLEPPTVGAFKVVIVAEEEIVVENAVFIVSALDI